MITQTTNNQLASIQIDQVSKVFHQGKKTITVLNNVSLQIYPGEIYGVIGVNGSGKTTLAKIISSLTLPDQGYVYVQQRDVAKEPEKVKEHIGLSLGVDRSFYYRLTAEQNLEYFGTMHEIPSRLLRQRIDEYLHQFDLGWAKKLQYMKFSSGMKRKLDLIRSMLPQPSIFILDEPTNGIDPHSQEHIRKMLRQLKKEKKTILLITHNLHEADLLCDRIGILDEGNLVWQGSVVDFEQYKGVSSLICECENQLIKPDEAARFIESASNHPCIRKVNILPEKTSFEVYFDKNETSMMHVLNFIATSNLPVTKINTLTPSIEDIFREFVSNDPKKRDKLC
jgi:ABC-2 type transport system ATP-binding protein